MGVAEQDLVWTGLPLDDRGADRGQEEVLLVQFLAVEVELTAAIDDQRQADGFSLGAGPVDKHSLMRGLLVNLVGLVNDQGLVEPVFVGLGGLVEGQVVRGGLDRQFEQFLQLAGMDGFPNLLG